MQSLTTAAFQHLSRDELKKRFDAKMAEVKHATSQKRKAEDQGDDADDGETHASRRALRKKEKEERKPLKKQEKQNARSDADKIKVDKQPAHSLPTESPSKSEGVVFSKFDFVKAEREDQKAKKLTRVQLLEKAERDAQKLAELKVKNPNKAEEVMQQKSWEKAIVKEEGG